MRHIETISLKTTAKGKRVFLNNASIMRIGFTPGQPYNAEYGDNWVELWLDPQGNRIVSDTFKGAIIDLQNKQMSKSFPSASRVHVNYFPDGRIRIVAYHHDAKIAAREDSLISKINANKPLKLGDVFAGTGLFGRQIKRGLAKAGINTQLCFATDKDRLAADIHGHNDELWEGKTEGAILLNDDLFTLDMNLVPQMDILLIGYPCSGFSIQQSSRRAMDTEHTEAGLLFVPLLELISRANPALIIIEDSRHFEDSDTDRIISLVLKATGYLSTSTVVKGTQFGGFEIRARLAKVFYSKNLPPIDLGLLDDISISNTRTVADIVEPICNDDKAWKNLDYIKVKNTEKHHSHKFYESSLTDNTMAVMGANYGKIQPDSPMLAHPTNPDLHRILTPAEHCNVRTIIGNMKKAIVSLSTGQHHLCTGTRTNSVKAHKLLGNSISPEPWEFVGEFIGNCILQASPLNSFKLN